MAYWTLINNRSGKPLYWMGTTRLYKTKSRALIKTMDFPNCHVEKVEIVRKDTE